VQVEVVVEFTLDTPKPICRPVWRVPLFGWVVERDTAADEIRKREVGWIGGVVADIAGVPEPDIEVGWIAPNRRAIFH
jgi:hypothetical protein